jgi:hypothetical protein
MQVGRQWFTIGMGLCAIFCTVALAPAAERPTMIVVGGNDGMLHKANGLGSASKVVCRIREPGYADRAWHKPVM